MIHADLRSVGFADSDLIGPDGGHSAKSVGAGQSAPDAVFLEGFGGFGVFGGYRLDSAPKWRPARLGTLDVMNCHRPPDAER
jgi:hypothetical protein